MMAISTQTQALLEFYNQKNSLDVKQLSQVNVVQTGYTIKTGIGSTDQIKVWGTDELIGDYNNPIQKLDTRIIEINNQIQSLQQQVLNIGQYANSVGCGITQITTITLQGIEIVSVGFTTVRVYEDVVQYNGYTFEGTNPFNPINGNLAGNIGIGTEDYVTEVLLGHYYGPIEDCRRKAPPVGFGTTIVSGSGLTFCTDDQCAGYAGQISNLQNQIGTLQGQRNDLITKVNFLKSGRAQIELQNYAYNQSKVQLNASISNNNSIISFLQDPTNADWL